MRKIITEVLRELAQEANPRVQDLFDKQTGTKLTRKGALCVNTLIGLSAAEYGDTVLFDGYQVADYKLPNFGLYDVVNYNHRVGYNTQKSAEGQYILETNATFELYDINQFDELAAAEKAKAVGSNDQQSTTDTKEDEGSESSSDDTIVFADEDNIYLADIENNNPIFNDSLVIRHKAGAVYLSPEVFHNYMNTFMKKIGAEAGECSKALTKSEQTLATQTYFFSPTGNSIYYIHGENPSMTDRLIAMLYRVRAKFTPELIGTEGHLLRKRDVIVLLKNKPKSE